LERDWHPAFTEVENCKVSVVRILKQVCDGAEHVEQIDLEKAGVAAYKSPTVRRIRLSLEEIVNDLSGGDGYLCASTLAKADKVRQELLDCLLDPLVYFLFDRKNRSASHLANLFEA